MLEQDTIASLEAFLNNGVKPIPLASLAKGMEVAHLTFWRYSGELVAVTMCTVVEVKKTKVKCIDSTGEKKEFVAKDGKLHDIVIGEDIQRYREARRLLLRLNIAKKQIIQQLDNLPLLRLEPLKNKELD